MGHHMSDFREMAISIDIHLSVVDLNFWYSYTYYYLLFNVYL